MTFIGLHKIKLNNAEFQIKADCVYDCVDGEQILIAIKTKKSTSKLKKNFKSQPLDKIHRIIYNEYSTAIIEKTVLLKMRNRKTLQTLPIETLAILLDQRFLIDE